MLLPLLVMLSYAYISNVANIGDIGNIGNIVGSRKIPDGCFEKFLESFS